VAGWAGWGSSLRPQRQCGVAGVSLGERAHHSRHGRGWMRLALTRRPCLLATGANPKRGRYLVEPILKYSGQISMDSSELTKGYCHRAINYPITRGRGHYVARNVIGAGVGRTGTNVPGVFSYQMRRDIFGAANHDPKVFADPDRIDLSRSRVSRHFPKACTDSCVAR
jgi:hypothetical protein